MINDNITMESPLKRSPLKRVKVFGGSVDMDQKRPDVVFVQVCSGSSKRKLVEVVEVVEVVEEEDSDVLALMLEMAKWTIDDDDMLCD